MNQNEPILLVMSSIADHGQGSGARRLSLFFASQKESHRLESPLQFSCLIFPSKCFNFFPYFPLIFFLPAWEYTKMDVPLPFVFNVIIIWFLFFN
jgi:hypothetical protein